MAVSLQGEAKKAGQVVRQRGRCDVDLTEEGKYTAVSGEKNSDLAG